MKINKVNLVYFSPTQTTQKILKSIASAFDAEIIDHDYTLKLGKEELPFFESDELVILGAPVYGGRIPKVTESLFKNIKGNNTPVIPVVVYGNRDFDDALLELCDYAQENNCKAISAGAFIAEHSFGSEIAGGRPNEEDLSLAKSFGEQVKIKLENVANINQLPEIIVSGNRPYKERGPASEAWCPETTEDCNACGICVNTCPMGIINPENPKEITNPAMCIHCCSCVKKCPKGAKQFTADVYFKVKNFLIENCGSVHKEPKLFV